MTQEEFKQKLQGIVLRTQNLIKDGGVISDTALYANLNAAEYLLMMAGLHTREYNEEFAEIHSKNHKEDQE